MANQLSADDQAVRMAEQMIKGGAGALPESRSGDSGAEGGFTSWAGGKPIDDDDDEKARGDKGMVSKAAKTGAAMTSEPGRDGGQAKTGAAMTSEPGHEESSSQPGEASALSQNDDSARSRKAGQVGVSGGSTGGGMSEDEDAKMRSRKDGKIGMSKAAVSEDDEDEEEDEDEEDMEMSCKKSADQIDADALIKSLEVLEAIAQGSTIEAPADRRAELGQRLAEGTLSKSEMRELHDLTDAEDFDEEDLSKSEYYDDSEPSFQDQFADDEDLQKGYEVSDFLERHSQLTAAALDQVQSTLRKSLDGYQDRASTFNVQLAKSLRGMAQLAQSQESLIKSLAERLETVENMPLPRQGVTRQSQVLNKSMLGGEVDQGDRLSKAEVFTALEQMAMSGKINTPSGQPITEAVAMLETSGQISKSLLADVTNWTRQSGTVRVN